MWVGGLMSVRDDLRGAYIALRADLLRFLTARLGDAAAAEDIYQDLYLRLDGAALPAAIEEPRAFLYKMAYNLANDRARAARRRGAREQEYQDTTTHKVGADAVADAPAAEDVLDARRRLARVMGWIAALPPRAREVFTLHRLQGVSHQEIASRLGITTKAVEKNMANAFRILGERASENSDTPEGRGTDAP